LLHGPTPRLRYSHFPCTTLFRSEFSRSPECSPLDYLCRVAVRVKLFWLEAFLGCVTSCPSLLLFRSASQLEICRQAFESSFFLLLAHVFPAICVISLLRPSFAHIELFLYR